MTIKAGALLYMLLAKERETRLETIAQEIHFWQYDRDEEKEQAILQDNQQTDTEMYQYI